MTVPNYKFIRLQQSGVRAELIINRPEVRNALNLTLIEEAIDAVGRLPSTTRVLVLRGEGEEAFAAGADIGELVHRTAWTDMDSGPRRQLARLLELAPFVTVAAIRGYAFGGGLELALACHLRVADDSARLGLPEIKLGVIPGNGGTARLTRLVGRSRALQAMLFAETFTAEQARAIGLVNWVYPQQEFSTELDALCQRIERLPRIATRAIVDCVSKAQESPMEFAIENEHRWFQLCLQSPDKAEGVEAFLQKRTPQFN